MTNQIVNKSPECGFVEYLLVVHCYVGNQRADVVCQSQNFVRMLLSVIDRELHFVNDGQLLVEQVVKFASNNLLK